MNIKKDEILEQINDFKKKCSYMIKPFLILLIMYLLGMSAIIRANFNYIDDMGRVAKGYKGWEGSSRYISCFLSSFIHGDSYLTDVSPLPQFIAILFLVLSSIIILYVISVKVEFSLWQLIGIIPLGMSPYFLECISYKYDSPYMALSILASIVPILLKQKNKMIYGISVVCGTLVVCTTYQASTGIFPMLVILLCMKDWNEEIDIKQIIKFVLTSVIGYGMGLIIFKLFIMQHVPSYISNDIPGIKEIVPMTLEHFNKYLWHIRTDFKMEWLIVIAIMAVGYVWVLVRDSHRNKILTIFLAIISLILMLCLAFGIYPVFTQPLYSPRAMYGFGVFIAFLSAMITSAKKMYIEKIVCVLLSWFFFAFSFTYGNALVVQSIYTDFRVSMVMDDLNDMERFTTDETKTVQISGTIGYSPIISNMPQDYKMLNRLVPVTFRESWMWGQEGFFSYYGIKNSVRDTTVDLTTYELPVIKNTMYHTIKAADNYILIELK